MRLRRRDDAPIPRAVRPPPLPLPQGEAQAPPDQAPVRSGPQWEYKINVVTAERSRGLLGWRQLEALLNAEGAEGWELVSIDGESATFKRRRDA